MDFDEIEQKYFNQFKRKCRELKTKKVKRDEEGTPTLFSGSKKRPWFCQPWGKGYVSLSVFDHSASKSGETLHGKTLGAVVRKFKKYIPQDNVSYILGDSEGTIIFPISSFKKVVRHFGLAQRKASPAQLAYREKFAAKMREKKKNG